MNTLRSNKTNIAIINDDKEQAKHLGFSLKNLGYNVYHYSNPFLILQDEKIENIQLFIIDMDLPQLNGLSFYKQLKSHCEDKKIYVFSISGQQHLEAVSLRSGIDDFISKPLNIEGVIARIGRLFDKEKQTIKVEKLKLGNLFLDYEKWMCTWYGKKIELTKKEYLILQHLVRRPGVIFDRNHILDICYGNKVTVDDRSVDSMIKRIRRKFEQAHPAKDKFDRIKTKYGTGYSWESQQLYQTAS